MGGAALTSRPRGAESTGEMRSLILMVSFSCAAGCSPATSARVGAVELARFPIETLAEVLTTTGVALDLQTTSDGNGALRVTTEGPTTVRLFETGDLDVENARLIYQARLRTEGLEGRAYLEMWCQFDGRGEYFSRDVETPVTGSAAWGTEETPFFLRDGENPDNVKLNLVVEGAGTVWIDDVRLLVDPF